MLPSHKELRRILVELWCVVSSPRWIALQDPFSDSVRRVLENLSNSARFRLSNSNLGFLTQELRQALIEGSPDDMVVTLCERRWLKLQLIGRGGQGEVWLACPCDFKASEDQLVAIKFPKSGATPNAIQHCQREIDILGRVKSDYIASLVDSDTNSCIAATKLVDGKPLEEIVQTERRLSVAQTVQIGIDICHALEVLLVENWIHKDVKPANIIIEPSRRAVLIDFGLSEEPSAVLRTAGTAYYIAPEVFFPEFMLDARVDVYSLSATLYRLLSGKPPHFQHCLRPRRKSSSMAELDAQSFRLVDAAIECDLGDLRREIPRQLCELIIRGLSTDREQRPSTVMDFRVELEGIREKYEEAIKIEQELWGLSKILLMLIQSISYDADYGNKEEANANMIRRQLEQSLKSFPALMSLREKANSWSGIEVAYVTVPQTIKTFERIKALSKNIEVFLSSPVGLDTQDRKKRTLLLKNLIARTVEGIRLASVNTVSAAHDWHTVSSQLGLLDLSPQRE